jgi:hypothetical protein
MADLSPQSGTCYRLAQEVAGRLGPAFATTVMLVNEAAEPSMVFVETADARWNCEVMPVEVIISMPEVHVRWKTPGAGEDYMVIETVGGGPFHGQALAEYKWKAIRAHYHLEPNPTTYNTIDDFCEDVKKRAEAAGAWAAAEDSADESGASA